MDIMYSVGIDAAKGKSTVCILNQYGEVIVAPHDIKHNQTDLKALSDKLKELKMSGEVKIVMEATGIYHWPVFNYLKERGYFVSTINPLRMKIYSKDQNFRGVKTDNIDATTIAIYGTEKWNSLVNSELTIDDRAQLQTLSRAYDAYQKPKVNLKQVMDLELEKAMPGIKDILTKDDKLNDFVLEFWHFDNISKISEKQFLSKFEKWAKKKGHQFRSSTPTKIYKLANEAIPTVPANEITKLTVTTSVQAVMAIDKGLNDILTQALEIAKKYPEYEVAIEMSGIGDTLAPLLIAEIGDIRKYKSKKALVCSVGIDVPPYESGKFKATGRVITKKGNRHLRRHLFLVMKSITRTKPKSDTAVYDFITKKKAEHKTDKQAKVAGMRKFLHIYYARVKERYKELGIWEV